MTNGTIEFTHDLNLRITSGRLTPEQIKRAKVLGGPREVGGIEKIEIDGQTAYGHLSGQAATARGLQLGAIVHPTYQDAVRQQIVDRQFGSDDVTAAQIDRAVAERDANNEVP